MSSIMDDVDIRHAGVELQFVAAQALVVARTLT